MLTCISKVKASTTLRNSHSDGINSCLLVDAAGGAWRCASITWRTVQMNWWIPWKIIT